MKSWRLPKGDLLYLIVDYLSATLSWFVFVIFRRTILEARPFTTEIFDNDSFRYSILVVPVIWLMVYIILDRYKNVYRMSRLTEIARTFFSSLAGVLLLFFTILLDDLVNYLGGYKDYYLAFTSLLATHFTCTVFFRVFYLSLSSRRIRTGKFSFNTLIIGRNVRISEIYQNIINRKRPCGGVMHTT